MIQTRIKVIKRCDDIRYIPQSKGFINGWSNWTIGDRCVILFIPLIGQIYLLSVLIEWINSLFWTDLCGGLRFYCHFDSGTEEYAKALIDFINNEINEVKKPKVKKEISYIKYP